MAKQVTERKAEEVACAYSEVAGAGTGFALLLVFRVTLEVCLHSAHLAPPHGQHRKRK